MDITLIGLWLTEIEEHGITLVLFLMILFLWFIPWVKDMKQVVASRQNKKQDHLELQIRYEAEINRVLLNVLDKYKCQWAILWQFHNGAKTLGGVPFLKMSVTNEVVQPNFSIRGDLYQQIPLAVFLEAVTAVKDNGYLTVGVDDHIYMSIVNGYLRDGVARGYYVRVDDIQGRMIGILSVGFAVDNMGMFDKQIDDLKNYSSRISMALAQISAVTPQRRREGEEA